MTDLTTVVYTTLIVFGIIGLTEVAFAWYDISHHDRLMMIYRSSGAVNKERRQNYECMGKP